MGLFDFIKKKITTEEQVVTQKNINTSDNFNVVNNNVKFETKQVYLLPNIKEQLKKRYIAFDIETTGLSSIEDRIIELGAVLFEDGKIIERFSSLINTGKANTDDAIRINNISNDMLQTAPNENEIYPKFIDFLGDAIIGETIICAHNANFDINFLKNTLERLDYNGNIRFIDTLSISRDLIYGLENYKQATLEKYFNIYNEESHRAVSDAETCGKILWQLLHYENETDEIIESCSKNNIKCELDEYEKIFFAYIVNLIDENNLNIDYIGAKKSNGYVNVNCLYNFIKYKFTKNGKYIIISNKYAKNIKMQTEPCSLSEGGTEFVRAYFNSLIDMKELDRYIIEEFQKAYKSMEDYIDGQSRKERIVSKELQLQYSLTNVEAKNLVEKEKESKLLENYCNEIKIKKIISRNEITINPINTRIPISEIKILDDFYNWEVLVNNQDEDAYNKWMDAQKYYSKAIELRQAGEYNEAIKNLDIARENGHITYYLYEEYAMTYHKLCDYDNEIEILEEGMKVFSNDENFLGLLTARRNKAVQAVYNLKEKENLQKQANAIKKIQKEQSNEPIVGRGIIQMNDEGKIIKKYISIAEAVRQTGVNSKSIRDAAKGVQKHAGGFVWKYEDEIEKKMKLNRSIKSTSMLFTL